METMDAMRYAHAHNSNLGGLEEDINELLRISKTPWDYPLPVITRTPGTVSGDNASANNAPEKKEKGWLDSLKEQFGWNKLSSSEKSTYTIVGAGIIALLFIPRD